MPIIKSAIKKQRADKAKAEVNRRVSSRLKTALKAAKSVASSENIAKLYSAVDRAVKSKVLKLNTASRIKAGVVRVAKVKATETPFGGKKKAPTKTPKKK